MFKSYYELKIIGKDLKRFIRMLYKLNIYLENIKITDNECFIKVDKKNYNKILKVKTSYQIELIRLYGIEKIINNFKKNNIFILSLIVGNILLLILSNLIFEIEVIHNDKDIRELVLKELNKYDIKKFKLIKKYEYIENVKKDILNNNKEKIEWIEIERIGTKYNVRIEKRILNNEKKEEKVKHVVAKKSGIIKKIVAENGEIIKKINDYVKEGEIIVSGKIYKNDKVVNNVSAKGNVYAEVWYEVKVELPINYQEKILTNNENKILNIKILNKDINLFKKEDFKNKISDNKTLFNEYFNLITINYLKEKEIKITNKSINDIALEFASKRIKEKLKDDEYIISQKKLKTSVNNSTIIVDIFFKVYENISRPEYFSIEEG